MVSLLGQRKTWYPEEKCCSGANLPSNELFLTLMNEAMAMGNNRLLHMVISFLIKVFRLNGHDEQQYAASQF